MAILTAAGVGAAVVAALGGLKEIASGAIKIIVITASIAFAITFASALISLISLLSNAVATSVVGEVFGIVSMCLPFDMAFVFGNLLLIIDGILLFLIAKKTWELVSNVVSFGK